MNYITLIHNINKYILNPIIVLLFAVATLVFLWGLFQFLYKFDDDGTRESGKRSMVWGLAGMFIMLSVYGIIYVVLGTLGIDPASIKGLPTNL